MFFEIMELAIGKSEMQVAPYFTKYRKEIDGLFTGDNSIRNKNTESIIIKNIREAVEKGCFANSAIGHFQYFQWNTIEGQKEDNEKDDKECLFLYQCLLQAVRIIALFHDAGHPPYSHAVEMVLRQLYDKSLDEKCSWNSKKRETFQAIMGTYISENLEESEKRQTIYSGSSSVKSQLHEKIGISLLQSAINDTIPEMFLKETNSNKKTCHKITKIVYYIYVVELAMGMLLEKNDLLKAFHKIVDGTLDADRLDYIMRDSLNSGIDWGKIPYKRLINLSKLVCPGKNVNEDVNKKNSCLFAVAYPKRISDDIVDIFLIRSKIFSRINYHHRCVKKYAALQRAILELSEDYLYSECEDEISPGIEFLWLALDLGVGDRTIRIIQWNDSWLISVLHKALINIIAEGRKNDSLRRNLEEILLNKNHYHALFKRGAENNALCDQILDYARITKDQLCSFFALKNDDKQEYLELLNDKLKIKETIEECMEKIKQEGCISDYLVYTNDGRKKIGLSGNENYAEGIYLYDDCGCYYPMDITTLTRHMESIKGSTPWLYIFFAIVHNCDDTHKISDYILKDLVKNIGEKLNHPSHPDKADSRD